MLRAIKNQFRVQWSTILAMAGLELAFFAAGLALLAILMRTIAGEDDGSFPLGSILAAFAGGVFIFANAADSFRTYFNAEVSLGCTRRQFLVSALLQNLVMSIFGIAVATVCSAVEDTLNVQFLYSQYTPEIVLFPYFLRWGIVLGVTLTVSGSFCGALLNRFGGKAQAVLLSVWFLLCVTWPGLAEELFHTDTGSGGEVNGLISGIASVIRAAPQWVWPCTGILLLLAALVSTWVLVVRETVK